MKISIKPVPFCLLLLLAATSALAQSLDELRQSGALGERFDGYVEALDASAQASANAINGKRRNIYQQRASEQGVSVEQIGRVYATEILEDAPPGTRFRQANGVITTK
ncbi:MAG: DUF1318 domain-containing protein [Pseudomonadota bacterium]